MRAVERFFLWVLAGIDGECLQLAVAIHEGSRGVEGTRRSQHLLSEAEEVLSEPLELGRLRALLPPSAISWSGQELPNARSKLRRRLMLRWVESSVVGPQSPPTSRARGAGSFTAPLGSKLTRSPQVSELHDERRQRWSCACRKGWGEEVGALVQCTKGKGRYHIRGPCSRRARCEGVNDISSSQPRGASARVFYPGPILRAGYAASEQHRHRRSRDIPRTSTRSYCSARVGPHTWPRRRLFGSGPIIDHAVGARLQGVDSARRPG